MVQAHLMLKYGSIQTERNVSLELSGICISRSLHNFVKHSIV